MAKRCRSELASNCPQLESFKCSIESREDPCILNAVRASYIGGAVSNGWIVDVLELPTV